MHSRCNVAPPRSHIRGPTGPAARAMPAQIQRCRQVHRARGENSRNRRSARLNPSAAWPRSQIRNRDSEPGCARSTARSPAAGTARDNTAWPPDRPECPRARPHQTTQIHAAADAVSRRQLSHLCPKLCTRVFRIQLLQLLPELARLQVTRLRHSDPDFHDLIATMAVARGRGHTFLAQAQLLSALRPRRDLQLRAPVDGRYLDLRTQRGLPRRDRHSHVNVVGFAPEHRVLAYANDDVEITRAASVGAGIALARDAYALAIARSCLDAHLQRLCPLHRAFTVAHRAGWLDLARPAAAWTGHIELHAA